MPRFLHSDLDVLDGDGPVVEIVFKVHGGDVYIQPIAGVTRYWKAVRRALDCHGYRLREVTLCKA